MPVIRFFQVFDKCFNHWTKSLTLGLRESVSNYN